MSANVNSGGIEIVVGAVGDRKPCDGNFWGSTMYPGGMAVQGTAALSRFFSMRSIWGAAVFLRLREAYDLQVIPESGANKGGISLVNKRNRNFWLTPRN
jgi:hypothetical protein